MLTEEIKKETNTIRLLIVDDYASNREMIKDAFQAYMQRRYPLCSFNIVEAENGLLGIQAVHQCISQFKKSFDLIIMDFQMPELDGEQAASAIYRLEQSLAEEHKSFLITWTSLPNKLFAHSNRRMEKPLDKIEFEGVLDEVLTAKAIA